MRVEVTRDAQGGTRADMFDARQLYDEAGLALEAGRFDRALELYGRLVATFPDSRWVPAALFGAGLALEEKGDRDAAIARYLDLVRRAPATRHALDAHIRAAIVTADLGRWRDALRCLDDVAARADLTDSDRIELHARRGAVLVDSRRYAEAETALAAAIALRAEVARVPRDRASAIDSFLAMASYYLGEIPRRQSEAMRLQLPESALERDIEAKAKLILTAQRRFEDTIRVGNLEWATAAGYQLGAMQEDMGLSLIAAPVPRALAPNAAAVYTTEVRALARAHFEKAIAAHEMNLKVAELNAVRTPWSERSRQRIPHIRRFLQEPVNRQPAGARARGVGEGG